MDTISLWPASGLAVWVAAEAARATTLLLLAFGAAWLLRRASAGTRHLVWGASVAALLLLPILSATLPWRLEVVPAAAPPVVASIPGPAAADARVRSATGSPESTPPRTPPEAALGEPPLVETRSASIPLAWVLAAIWLGGALFVAGRLALGALLLRRVVRRGEALEDGSWSRPLYEAADRLGLAAAPRLVLSERAAMPFACGILRPAIVLPPEAREWPEERRRAVLLHELAHLRRFDLVLNTVARLACAAWWPHPLAWLAARRLRAESERACDDLVLSVGTRASEYADHLLQIVCAAEPRPTPAAALPLARRREFEGRMLAILERNHPRAAPGRPHVAVAVLALLALVLPLAAMAPAPSVPDDDVASSPPAAPDARGEAAAPLEIEREEEGDVVVQEDSADDAAVEDDAEEPEELAGPWHGAAVQDTPNARVRDALVRLLDDPAAEVRLEAVWALGDIGDRAVVPHLAARLDDESPEVREMAGWALGEIGDPAALPRLTAALRRDAEPEVRAIAVWALGEIADDASADALTAALADASPAVREMAAWGLGQIEPAAAPDALVSALRDESAGVRKSAAWALGQIEDPASAMALVAALRDPGSDAAVRETALWALGELDSEEAQPALIEALGSEDPAVRAAAARALAGRGSRAWPWPRPRPRIR